MSVYNFDGSLICGKNYENLHGKPYYALGDSIVANSGTVSSRITLNGEVIYGYTQAIEDKYGVVCVNKGQSGHTIVQDYSVLTEIDYSNASLVTIGYGVNDARLDVPLGEIGVLDATTFSGALSGLLKKIYSDNSDCRVVVLTPIQRLVVNNFGSFTQNNNGDTLEDFSEMCKSVANHYGTLCVDLFHNSGLNSVNLASSTAEGVHPLNNGYERMTNVIIHNIDLVM